MPALQKNTYINKRTITSLRINFRLLRDPLAVQKIADPFPDQKFFAKTENIWNHLTLQPLLASHVCVSVCVCVCVFATVWCCVVEVSAKKHITKPRIYQSRPTNLYL